MQVTTATAASPGALEHGNSLRQFGYADVSLASGPHQRQLQNCHQVLMNLDDDSLLRPFRAAASLPAPGQDLGGWYSAPRYLAETFGQWISALSRYYAATGHEATRAKVERLMAEYVRSMEPTGKLFRINGNPLYLHDKLTMGIADSVWVLGPDAVQKMLAQFAESSREIFVEKHSGQRSWDLPDGFLSGYNFAATYLTAWQRGGAACYLELAKQDLEDGFCEQLARGENALPGRHAYAHMNTLGSAVKAYLTFGDPTFLRAAVNGLAFAEQQAFSTGGYGPSEMFLPRAAFSYVDRDTNQTKNVAEVQWPADTILREHYHFETGCGSYAHFNLTRALLCITKKSYYGDTMERVMYNAALGALPLNKFGKAFYQSDYHRYAKKAYFDGYRSVVEDEWPCCSGSLPQLAADYGISSYFADSDGVYVNLYVPSTLRWSQAGLSCSLSQTGDYPLTDTVSFVVSAPRPTTFALRFRIPAWARSPTLQVNGSKTGATPQPGTFAEVRRRWRPGDRVELTLPKANELVACDADHPQLVSLRCGPMVLFAIGTDLPRLNRETLLAARQSQPGAAEWRSGDVTFLPWWIITDETYTTYHDVS